MTTTPECVPPSNLLPAQQLDERDRSHLSVVPTYEPLELSSDLEPVTLSSWYTLEGADRRRHELQRLALHERHHLMLHTDTADGQPSNLVFALMPGWTETISGVILKNTHAGLSHMFPEATFDTHATYGTDGTVSHYNPLEIGKQTVEYAAREISAAFEWLHVNRRIEQDDPSIGVNDLGQNEDINRFSSTLSHYISLGIGEKAINLAAQRTFDTFAQLYAGKDVVPVATSMSAAVLARIVKINREGGRPLNIVDPVLYAPCLVPTEDARAVFLGRFAAHLVHSTFDELIRDSSPREALRLINNTLHSRPPASDLLRIIGLGLALSQGTPKELCDMLAELGPHIVQGANDCLRNKVLEQHPLVTTNLLPGRGHSMSLNSADRVALIGAKITEMGVYQPR